MQNLSILRWRQSQVRASWLILPSACDGFPVTQSWLVDCPARKWSW